MRSHAERHSVRTIASALALAVVCAGCASQGGGTRATSAPPLEIAAVHLTAANHYVDLRYRVTDPARATAMLGPKVKPRLVDERTGRVMYVPTTAKLGPLRTTQAPQKTGHVYFVLFVNSAGLERGSVVTAELGDLRFEHLRVE